MLPRSIGKNQTIDRHKWRRTTSIESSRTGVSANANSPLSGAPRIAIALRTPCHKTPITWSLSARIPLDFLAHATYSGACFAPVLNASFRNSHRHRCGTKGRFGQDPSRVRQHTACILGGVKGDEALARKALKLTYPNADHHLRLCSFEAT